LQINRFTFTLSLFLAATPAFFAKIRFPAPHGASPSARASNPGTQRAELHGVNIDDGYWQGAPVGGFGAGTFSRSERGHFERWHIKAHP